MELLILAPWLAGMTLNLISCHLKEQKTLIRPQFYSTIIFLFTICFWVLSREVPRT